MKRASLIVAVTVALGASYLAGMRTESVTHAYHVHEVTGASLYQILKPTPHVTVDEPSQLGEDDEVCSPSIPCEANQD